MTYTKPGIAALAVTTLMLGGCVSPGNVPEFAKDIRDGRTDDEKKNPNPRIEEIVEHLTCELRLADTGTLLSNPNYSIGVNLTVVVEDEIGFSPTLTYKEPLDIADTKFSATLAGEWSRGRTRKFTTTYTLDSTKLKKDSATPASCEAEGEKALRGNLGLAQIVTDGLAAKEKSVAFTDGKPNADTGPTFGSTVEFVVTRSGKAGGGWSLQRYVVPGDSLYREKRVLKDTVILSFNPVYPPSKSQTELLQRQIERIS